MAHLSAQTLPWLLALLLSVTLTPCLTAQTFKAAAMADYEKIVSRQNEFEHHQFRLPAGFDLGEGAIMAYTEGGELRCIVVRYEGQRSGDWQELYFRGKEPTPFFVFSRVYNRETKVLSRNRLYYDKSKELLGWELNDVAQPLKNKDALLTNSRILEDARQLSQLATQQREEAEKKKTPPPAKPGIEEALNAPENSPEIAKVPPKEPTPPADPKKPEEAAPAAATAPVPPVAQQDEAPPNPELQRWAAWANATRENKETLTPFPAELVLGKVELAPLPQPEGKDDTPKVEAPEDKLAPLPAGEK